MTLFFACAYAFPQETRAWLVEMKHRYRQYIMRRTGRQAAQEMAQAFYHEAVRDGFDPDLVRQVLKEYEEETITRLGALHANIILEKLDIFE
ncbi:MAG: hypothetical protein GY792_09990 [Gammaproteobacteria bacterium]|nr:hypothetical protein [Gammaproteobacteria bacterium]